MKKGKDIYVFIAFVITIMACIVLFCGCALDIDKNNNNAFYEARREQREQNQQSHGATVPEPSAKTLLISGAVIALLAIALARFLNPKDSEIPK